MLLKAFRIQNYRSIDDSGIILVSKLTAFVGRNESGKSNLLRALHSLNPAEGFKPLDKHKDFPRHRQLGECTDETPVVTSVWELSKDDRAKLAEIWPRGKSATTITIGRRYDKNRTARFGDISSQEFDQKNIKLKIRRIVLSVKALAAQLDDTACTDLNNAAEVFETSMEPGNNRITWANAAKPALAALREALSAVGQELTEAQDAHVECLEELADDDGRQRAARSWVRDNMPVFMLLDEYPELSGHQNVSEYLIRKSQDESTISDKNFGKMCKVVGLEPEKLQELLEQKEHQTRNHLANQAGTVITKQIQHLWKDRPLKVRFDADAEHLTTFISNPSATGDVEMNLNERSRGFQWFFSFYVIFAADTDGGKATDTIFLLDEPGLYLHAKSQRDLLTHLKTGFSNQILYTTHSPFMVPTDSLDTVKTVNISKESRTTVSNDLSGDSRTLFPLQAALGYDLAQSLFVGPNNLIVEGVTDFWILSSISEYLAANGGTGLRPDITITPAGGAQKVPYMVTFLTSEKLKVVTLLDHEKGTMATRNELVKTKLIKDRNILFVSEAFGDSEPKEADIEDLLDPKIYEDLVRESYAPELKSVKLAVNGNIPRIVKRFEESFEKAELEFHKTRPMNLLRRKMGTEPDKIVTEVVADRFSRLIKKINSLFPKN